MVSETVVTAVSLARSMDSSSLTARPGATLYVDLAGELRRLVETGALAAESRLPAERALASALGISRVTVASAYRHLREDGWLRSKQGAGTFVAPREHTRPWGSMMVQSMPDVVEMVNAAPESSSLLADAYEVAARSLARYLPAHGYVPMGLPALREAVARRFTARGLPTTADQILITAGAGDSAHAVFETLLEPGNRVLIEHPTYPGSVELVTASGGRCVPVPVDPGDPDAFVAAADRAARQSAPTLAYFMPDFSNPSGFLLPTAQRRVLAATMHRHAIVTVVDEVAVDLSLDEGRDDSRAEPFGLPTPDAATVVVGSLSKTVWGGLRVGWVRSDPRTVARIAATYQRRQLSVSIVDQMVAIEMLAQYDTVLAERRNGLRATRDHLVGAVRERLPDWTFRTPGGGLSLWCALPPGVSSTDLVAAAHGRGLLLAEGRRFGTGHAFDDHVRLPYTRSTGELSAAVDILASLDARSIRAPLGAMPDALV